MGLFKRKPREVKDDDSLLVKLWYTPRTHGLIVLGIYAIFFLIVLLIIKTPQNDLIKKKKDESINLKSYFSNLDNKNLTYDYVIKTKDNRYLFSGTRINNEISGKITSKDESYNIKFVEGSCKVIEKNRKGIEIISEKPCPTDIKYDYFDYNKIYSLIEFLQVKQNKDNEYLVKLNDDITYEIYYVDEFLDKLIIKDQDDIYELGYIINYTNEELVNNIFYKSLNKSIDKNEYKQNNIIKLSKEKFETEFVKEYANTKNLSGLDLELSVVEEPLNINIKIKNEKEEFNYTYNNENINKDKIN